MRSLWQGLESLIVLATDRAPLDRLDVTLCVDSPVSDQLCFTIPLLTYEDGKWTSVAHSASVRSAMFS